MEQYIWPVVTLLLGLFTGSFLKSYMSKKAENLATKEDIQDLVTQMKAVTQATEKIKAEISVDVWNRQKQWELKRDAVYSVMLALSKAEDAVVHLSSVLKEQKDSQTPDQFAKEINTRWTEWSRALVDLDTKRGLAMLVCGDKYTEAARVVRKELKEIASQLGKGSLDAYDNQTEILGGKFVAVITLAQQELGMRPIEEA